MRGTLTMRLRNALLAGAVFCPAAAWTWATAAEVEPIDPEAERLGQYSVQTGAFLMTPRLFVGGLYNDNVFARDFASGEGWAAYTEGSVTFASTWRRHFLGVALSADAIGYDEEFDTENQFNWRAGANGRIDVTDATGILGSASYGRFTEQRGGANSNLDAVSPVDYGRAEGEAGLQHQFSRMLLAGYVNAETIDFDDVASIFGGEIDQDERDYDAFGVAFDASREFRAGYDGFIRVIANRREYTDTTAAGRDSDGMEGRVGVRSDITDLIEGEFFVGYMSRDYEAFRRVDGFAFGARADWTPTAAWRIAIEGLRSIEETNDATSSSFITTAVELTAMRSVLERLSLGPTIGYRRHDFQESEREDEILTLGFDGRFAVNRTVSIDAGYRFFQRDTTLVGGDYDQNRMTVGLTLRR